MRSETNRELMKKEPRKQLCK